MLPVSDLYAFVILPLNSFGSNAKTFLMFNMIPTSWSVLYNITSDMGMCGHVHSMYYIEYRQ